MENDWNIIIIYYFFIEKNKNENDSKYIIIYIFELKKVNRKTTQI